MAGDAGFANVVLLVPFSGADASTTFTDASSYARTLTAVGSAQIDTAVSKFGGVSGLFPGGTSGVYAPYAPSLQLGANDFDIACWIYPTSSASMDFLAHRNSADFNNFWFLRRNTSGQIRAYVKSGGSVLVDITTTATVSSNAWTYIQFQRVGNTFSIYTGGSFGASATNSSAITSPSYPLWVGAGDNGGVDGMVGQMDDARITIGAVTRPTTVPTAAFPTAPPVVSGTVVDSTASPATRIVRAYRRDTGALLGSTTSTSGSYSMPVAYDGEVNVVCLDDVSGSTENDLILRTTPV